MEKNDAQVSGFAVVKKAPSPWKKNVLKKKNLIAYWIDKNKWVSRFLTFGDFSGPKKCSSLSLTKIVSEGFPTSFKFSRG